MGNFSSKSKKSKGPVINDTDRAILSLKTQRNKLTAQEKLLEQRIDHHVEVARQLAQERKRDRALLVLKKKKLTEQQLQQLHALILNVEGLLSNIEQTKQQQTVFGVLKQSTDILKQLQQQVTVEDVQKLVEDTAEARAYQEELSAVLAAPIDGVDEGELEEELAALEEQQLAAEVAAMPKAPEVPAAAITTKAKTQPAAQQQEEEEEEPAQTERRTEAPLMAS